MLARSRRAEAIEHARDHGKDIDRIAHDTPYVLYGYIVHAGEQHKRIAHVVRSYRNCLAEIGEAVEQLAVATSGASGVGRSICRGRIGPQTVVASGAVP